MKGLIELHTLPSSAYISHFLAYEQIIIEQMEHFQKRSFRSRFVIGDAQGLRPISIPLQKGKNQQLPITEVEVSYAHPWVKKTIQSIQTAYGKAPFFVYYAEDLFAIFQAKHNSLFKLNLALLEFLLESFQIGKNYELSTFYKSADQNIDEVVDLRNSIHKMDSLQSVFDPQPYPQLFEAQKGFQSHLSSLDLLFNCGPEAIFVLEQHAQP